MSLNESITKVSPLIQSSNGSSIDDLLVSWQMEEDHEKNSQCDKTPIHSNDFNWMNFLKLPLSSSDSDTSDKNTDSQKNNANLQIKEVSLKSSLEPLSLFSCEFNQPSSIPFHTSLGIPSPQPKGIPRGHIKLPEWFQEPQNSADMPAFLRKLRARYIHIHRRLHFLNNEKLSLLSYLQSKFQNVSQLDAFVQPSCHQVPSVSDTLPKEPMCHPLEIPNAAMESPHQAECHLKEQSFFDLDTSSQSSTHAHHASLLTCSKKSISPKPSSLDEISPNFQTPLVSDQLLQQSLNAQNTSFCSTKLQSVKVKNLRKKNPTTKQPNKTKRRTPTTVCAYPQPSTDSFPLSYWTSLPTNILRLWMSFFGMKSTKSSVSRSSILCSLSKISQYISLDASNHSVGVMKSEQLTRFVLQQTFFLLEYEYFFD
ncbi:uncharacterized protein LOC128883369 isoform X2 [Hylaeus volcanicus]|uniref:uncharacterized protein LOC128883369 isoform X2 n=1 Tax=Hylaeus volcanicus TaxID=313075 RepID=UPI0023B7F20D|nr:uncharacterized protein LOC128883369 isoform X2 [Hylaeus volcanicus]